MSARLAHRDDVPRTLDHIGRKTSEKTAVTHPRLVRTERHGDVALIVLDHPPVNALSAALRRELLAAIEWMVGEPGLHAAVLACDGNTFVAGADIREFDAPPVPPLLGDILAVLDSSPRPVVAAIQGTALGGGLELALACHARILAPDGRVGLPETRLGLIPGAGGTQRLPRLIGAPAALDIITTGRHVAADEALALGIVDEIATDIRAAAFARARALAASGQVPRVRDRTVPAFDRISFDKAVTTVGARARGALAPPAAAEAVGWASSLPFDEAVARERARSLELRTGPQSRALRYLFHAERQAARLPSEPRQEPRTRAVRHVGVVGGGTMGAGIAITLADAGFKVTLAEASADALPAAQARIAAVYDRQVNSGRLNDAARAERMERIGYTAHIEALRDSDLVIEAVIEDLAAKQAVFRALSHAVRRDCVLASNTSYLDLEALADVVDAPERVVGLHFFSPAHVMRLVEVVRARRSAPEAVATALSVVKLLGKQPVLCRNGEGFIGNRLLMRWRQVCEFAVEDGALPHEVDAAMEAYGMAMGYFAVSDLAGLDIAWAIRKRMAPARDPRARYVPIADLLCEAGRFGQKTGAGWYRHIDGKRQPDPEVTALIERVAAEKGIARRPIAADAIQQGVHAAMVNEGAKLLAEGIAQRPSDIDVVLVHGYGFPAWRGGPMHAADAIGLPEMLRRVEALHTANGPGWEPAPLLRELVASGRSFGDGN
jgi:3-hydroxyacyl-CoA dehydrogenase